MQNTKTLVRSDIAEAIHCALGFSHADAFKMIDQTLNMIVDELATKRTVKISGFATFTPYAKNQRMGRNPKTGKSYPITARTVLSFQPSPALKNQLI